jgi:inner membrane protein
MSPITHLLASWVVANIPKNLSRRDLFLITAAGVIPDIDGLGAVVEIATKDTANPMLWFTEYHHALHCVGFALGILAIIAVVAQRKWLTCCLAGFAFHLHLICDVVGAGGPDGYEWPIPYLLPFSNSWQWSWAGQWQLNAWPNVAITIGLLIITFRLAWSRGYSPLTLISQRADAAFVATLRTRFHYSQRLEAKAGG